MERKRRLVVTKDGTVRGYVTGDVLQCEELKAVWVTYEKPKGSITGCSVKRDELVYVD